MNEQGFASIPRALLHDPDAPRDAKIVYLVLSSYVGDTGTVWPSHARIAGVAGMSKSQVKLMLGWLAEHGHVLVTPRRSEDGKVALSNEYRLVAGATKVRKKVGQDVTRVGQVVTHPSAGQRKGGAGADPRQDVIHGVGQVVAEGGSGGGYELEPKNEKTPSGSNARKSARPAADKTPIPADWRRSDADVAWQAAEKIPNDFARPVTAEFVNYWTDRTDARGKKSTAGWSRTWRTWVSREWGSSRGATYRREHAAAPVRDFAAEREAARLERARAQFATVDPLASAR